jgi:glucosamine 6-phosphate synthetase-like amidotransferase/phosphosugar isomerase protein
VSAPGARNEDYEERSMTPAPALLALTVYACAWIAWTFPDLDGLRGGGLLVIGRGGREEFINSDFALSLPRDRDNASLNDLVFLDLTESNMDNLHQLIEQLGDLRAQKKRLDYESRQITTRIETKEREIMEAMDNQEITESGSAAGKVSLGEAVYPQVTDWDAVYKFIHENEYYHCLENVSRFLRTAKS